MDQMKKKLILSFHSRGDWKGQKTISLYRPFNRRVQNDLSVDKARDSGVRSFFEPLQPI